MSNPQSIQKTLGIGLTLGVVFLWFIALVMAVSVLRIRMNRLFDSALAETAQRIMPLAVVEIINRKMPGQMQNIMPFAAHDEYLVYLVRDNHGAILLKSHNADSAVFDPHFQKGFSSSESHRFYGASAVQDTLHIQVAEPLAQRQAAMKEMIFTLVWPLAILIPLCFFGTWLFVRYSLRQVLAFSAAIKKRDGGDLSPIQAFELPIEINTIADSLNDLLQRLRRAMELEHAFTANSAHELRTPIATALAQIQRLQHTLPAGSSLEQACKIEITIKRLSRLSEKLMQLAKAESGRLMSAEPHDLICLLRLIIEQYKHSYPDKKFQLYLPDNESFMSNLDADAFAILVGNLLDNAMKYGNKQAPVVIGFSSGTLRIVNQSAIIPADKLAQLNHRFVRLNSQSKGSGLGLAIVDAIVTGMHATMTLYSPATNRTDGFEVRINFPHTS